MTRIMFLGDHVCFPATNGSGRVYEGWIISLAKSRLRSYAVFIEKFRPWPNQNKGRLRTLVEDYALLHVDNVAVCRKQLQELILRWRIDVLIVSQPRNVELIGTRLLRNFKGLVLLDIHDDFVYKQCLVNQLSKKIVEQAPQLSLANPFQRYVKAATQCMDMADEYRKASLTYKSVDAVLFPTDYELEKYRRLYPEHARKLWPIQWCIDAGWRANQTSNSPVANQHATLFDFKDNDICFVASQELFNFDAVCVLVKDIMPTVCRHYPHTKLAIVGTVCDMLIFDSVLMRLTSENIKLIPRLDDLRQLYEYTKVVVVPLRYGTGLSIKLVEALQFGKAVVTSSIGCRGVPIQNGEHAFICDDVNSFASAVMELLVNSDRRAKFEKRARDFAKGRYSADTLMLGVERVLAGMSSQAPEHARGGGRGVLRPKSPFI